MVSAALPWSLPRWEDDPDFDLESHLIRRRLPGPGGRAEAEAHVAEQQRRAEALESEDEVPLL